MRGKGIYMEMFYNKMILFIFSLFVLRCLKYPKLCKSISCHFVIIFFEMLSFLQILNDTMSYNAIMFKGTNTEIFSNSNGTCKFKVNEITRYSSKSSLSE